MNFTKAIHDLETKLERQKGAVRATEEHLAALHQLKTQETSNAANGAEPPRKRT